jgi:ABC-2 type transport system ATP-binding protein
MTADLAIEAIGLKKSYGPVNVLNGISLQASRGTVYSLLGPNRILATLLSADAGSARVAGFDIVRERHQVRRHISLTGQNVAIDQLQTGEENLRLMGRLAGLAASRARDRARELLGQFGLADVSGRLVKNYSGGMRRRLDLAAGLVGQPSVIFLDEPTSGLDPRSRHAMWEAISGLAQSGVTIFLTTQYLEEADLLASHIAVINGGRVVAEGTPSGLKQAFGGQRLELVCADRGAFDRISGQLGKRVLTSDAEHLELSAATDGTAAHVRALLDEIDPGRQAVRSFTVHTATLDDVFLALTDHSATLAEEAHSG